MNNKADMTIDDLREVLLENELTNFDPVAEAFKVIFRGTYYYYGEPWQSHLLYSMHNEWDLR